MLNNAVNHRENMVNPIPPTELQWVYAEFRFGLNEKHSRISFFHFCFNLFIFILQNLYLCIFILISYNNNNDNN